MLGLKYQEPWNEKLQSVGQHRRVCQQRTSESRQAIHLHYNSIKCKQAIPEIRSISSWSLKIKEGLQSLSFSGLLSCAAIFLFLMFNLKSLCCDLSLFLVMSMIVMENNILLVSLQCLYFARCVVLSFVKCNFPSFPRWFFAHITRFLLAVSWFSPF